MGTSLQLHALRRPAAAAAARRGARFACIWIVALATSATAAVSAPASSQPQGAEQAATAPDGEAPAAGEADPSITQASAEPAAADKPRQIERVTNVRFVDRDGDQPTWLETAPHWQGDVYWVAVDSKLQSSPATLRRELDRRIELAAQRHLSEILPDAHAAQWVAFDADQLRRRGVVRETFEERVDVTSGRMQQAHALLAFDPTFAHEARLRWQEVQSASRLGQTGLITAVLLLSLAALCGYFRLDTATRGYYSRRLQFASAGAILAVMAAGLLAARWITWL